LAILVFSSVCESDAPYSRMSAKSPFVSLSRASSQNGLNDAIKKDLQYVDKNVIGSFAARYGIDFRLILAMIKQESRFNQNAQSGRGAMGLMQLMPETHLEIMEEIDIQDPYLPEENLRAGVYYVSKLSELFKGVKGADKMSLTLAAYNAGPSRIYDAQELAAYLGEDPHSWSSIRNMLPLLSKRFYSLHQAVWGTSRPPNGYYGGANQTVKYVDSIMKTYGQYCQPA